MRSLLVHLDGHTRPADAVDPAWVAPGAREQFWMDIESPTVDDRRVLESVLRVHELVVEDAFAEIHHPKVERYENLLYLILHGIAAGPSPNGIAAGPSPTGEPVGRPAAGDAPRVMGALEPGGFVTQDVDFLIGPNYLVTVHQGPSRSIATERAVCLRHADLFADGPLGICHRIVDQLVDHYSPEVDALDERLEQLEAAVFEPGAPNPIRDLLLLKRDVASLRRVTLPERDAVGRLARREFPEISEKMAYRFRDVYDHLVRLTDEAMFLQDRVTGLIDAHLSNQSNRLNHVMKVLTVIATIFMPLTVLTGVYGMNVRLPQLPGGEAAQFWWIILAMAGLSGLMLWFFRRQRWL